MLFEPLNRRLATLASIFAFLGVILGSLALATDYWTIGKIDDVTTQNGRSPVGQQVQATVWNACTLLDSLERRYASLYHSFRVCSNCAAVDTSNASVNSGPVHF